MNPLRWLLNLSALAAERRGGKGADLWGTGGAVDDPQEFVPVEIDGSTLLLETTREIEVWTLLSADRCRFARATRSKDGAVTKLTVFERRLRNEENSEWQLWEGPSLVGSLADAQTLGRSLLDRSDT